MKNLLITILFFNFYLAATAQVNVDSLFTIWNDTTQSDTNRLNAINDICFKHYIMIDADSTLHFGQQMLDFATERGLKKYQADALHNMGGAEMGMTNYEKSFELNKRSLVLRKEIRDKKGIGRSLANIGMYYLMKEDIINGLTHFEKALTCFEEIDDKNLMMFALNKIGSVYTYIGDYPRAIQYMSRSLSMSEDSDNVLFQVNTLVTLAYTCFDIKEFSKAKEYAERAIKVARKNNYKQGELEALLAIAKAFSQEGKYDESLAYCEEIISTEIKVAGFYILNNAYILSGWAYNKKGDHDNAIRFYKKAQELSKSLGSQTGLSRTAIGMGEVYKNKKDSKNAIKWCEESFSLSKDSNNLTLQSEACKCLYETHKMLKNGTQALAYYERFIILRDSMNKDEAGKKLQLAEFSNQLMADSIAYVEKELKMEMTFQEELYKKDKTRNILIGLGLMALLLAGGFWTRNRFVRKTNTQLKASKERAEQSEAVKQRFLANMSHEIRTPMHAISGMLKILDRNDHPRAQEVFLDAMQKSSDNLIVLLNDILDLSKIEAGKLDVENIPMKPAEVLGTIEQILQFKAEEKSLAFSIDIDESIPEWVMSDPTRLNQILTNLAGNAIKFTERGSVSITATKKNEFLLYEVRDTGIGIPDDKLLSIFDAFEQAEGSTSRRFGGTGLGLNISRQLVELMGGNIWAESEMGKGSSFFVSLPLVAVDGEVTDKQSLSEEQIMAMGAALSSKRILLAEDNQFNQMIAADDLEYYAKGMQVDIVENGALALEKAQTGLYDLILMDVQMPEMDGIEAALKIREWEQANGTSRIPIIAMTASLLKSEVNLCLEAGMDNYVPKPYEAEELVGRMYAELNQNQ